MEVMMQTETVMNESEWAEAEELRLREVGTDAGREEIGFSGEGEIETENEIETEDAAEMPEENDRERRSLINDDRGIGVIEMVLILVVLVGLVLIFKTQLTSIIGTVFDKVNNTINKL